MTATSRFACPSSAPTRVERSIACLLAGAAGDALGYAVEFLDEPRIRRLYGPAGIQTYDDEQGIALISDDTQMSLFTGAGILETLTTRPELAALLQQGPAACTPETTEDLLQSLNAGIWTAYQDWLITQTRLVPPLRAGVCGLLHNPTLFSTRAPGTTCLSALHGHVPGTLQHPINHSKGCGGVMRVAPVAIALAGRTSAAAAQQAGAMAAALTHSHPLGWLPAAYLIGLLDLLLNTDVSIEQAARQTAAHLQQSFGEASSPETAAQCAVFLDLIDQVFTLAATDLSDLEGIHRLGEGWTGEEALAIALFCALRHPDDLDAALIAAVNHRGDSDSTGAIAGNIMGAALGHVPARWLEGLELQNELTAMAQALSALDPAAYTPANGR